MCVRSGFVGYNEAESQVETQGVRVVVKDYVSENFVCEIGFSEQSFEELRTDASILELREDGNVEEPEFVARRARPESTGGGVVEKDDVILGVGETPRVLCVLRLEL